MAKKSVGSVVATIFIILITFVAVVIIWQWVIPMIQNSIGLEMSCKDADISIEAFSGYTCYDSSENAISVRMQIGTGDVNISGAETILKSGGDSVRIRKDFQLRSNEKKTFYFNLSNIGFGSIEGIDIAPIVSYGGVERKCGITSSVELPFQSCDLSEKTLENLTLSGDGGYIAGGSGSAPTITCYNNLDCGSPSYSGLYCDGTDVWVNYTNYTCLNPSTASSSCQTNINSQVNETCSGTCTAGACDAISGGMQLNWEVSSHTYEKTGTPSQPNAIVEDEGYIYIAGYEVNPSFDMIWIVEKRDKSDGSLIWERGINPSTNFDFATSLALDASNVYVVGEDRSFGSSDTQWRIEKLDKDGNSIWTNQSNPSPWLDRPVKIVVENSDLYIVGWESIDDPAPLFWWMSPCYEIRMRVEKRDATSGNLIWSQTRDYEVSQCETFRDEAKGLALDDTGLYILGHDHDSIVVEKRDKSDGTVIWYNNVDSVVGGYQHVPEEIIVDSTGIYTAGQDGFGLYVDKRDKNNGNVLWEHKTGFFTFFDCYDYPTCSVCWNDNFYSKASSLTQDSSYIYLGGTWKYLATGGTTAWQYSTATHCNSPSWLIEKRDKNNGNQVWNYTYDISDRGDDALALTTADANQNIFIAGYYRTNEDLYKDDSFWRIISINKTQ